MENKLGIIGKILMYLLMAAGVVFIIIILINGDILKDYDKSNLDQQSIMNGTLTTAAIAFAIATVLTLLFPLISIVTDVKKLIRSVIVVAGLALIYFISYSLADGNIEKYMLEPDYLTNEGTSKVVGSMLYLVYIVGGIAVVTTLASNVVNLVKR